MEYPSINSTSLTSKMVTKCLIEPSDFLVEFAFKRISGSQLGNGWNKYQPIEVEK